MCLFCEIICIFATFKNLTGRKMSPAKAAIFMPPHRLLSIAAPRVVSDNDHKGILLEP